MKNKQVDAPKCVYCKKDTNKDEFCYGCRVHVCDKCENEWSVAAAGTRVHSPKDHLKAAEEEE